MAATDQELEAWLKETWDKYENDQGYTGVGKLNLVASIGERGGWILSRFAQIRADERERCAQLAEKFNNFELAHEIRTGG